MMIGSGTVRILAMLLSGTAMSGDGGDILPDEPAQTQQSASPVPPPTTPPQADREQQIAALAALLLATLKTGDLKPAQIEAQLSLVIAQGQGGCGVSQAALAQAATQVGSLSPAAAVAVRNVTGALARCEVDGTAALANAQTIVEQGTTLGLAGGSSNYLSQ